MVPIIPKKQLKLHFLLGVEVQKSLRAYKGIGRGLRVSWFGSVEGSGLGVSSRVTICVSAGVSRTVSTRGG